MALIQYIGRIQFGAGERRLLSDELARAGISNPLVVSDRGLESTGVLDKALEFADPDRELTRFLDVPSNPTEAAVIAGLAQYTTAGCDGVLAVGGGSSLDCGKAIALLATNGGKLADYLAKNGGSDRIAPTAPVVAMPTTAGTDSEIGRGAGITLEGGDKEVLLSPRLVPVSAICDPDLTLGLPPRLTAATGIDAFTHAFEAFSSPAVNPPADAIALDAIARLSKFLPLAVLDGMNGKARWEVMMGALEAAMTTWKGLGASHAMSMAFDELGLHHGTVVGVLLPHTVNFLRDSIPEIRMDALASAVGATPGDLEARLQSLSDEIGLPESLQALGVPVTFLDHAAVVAERSAFNQSTPRPLSSDEYLAMLEAAFERN